MSRPIYATAAATCDLPRALLLGEALVRHLGEVDFRVLLLEHPRIAGTLRSPLAPHILITLDEIGCREWVHLAFVHGGAELAAVMQPHLIKALLREGDVVYLDPDVDVLAPLTAIEDALAGHDLVLLANERPDRGAPAVAFSRARRGRFDLGLLGVSGRLVEGKPGPGALAIHAFATFTAEPEPWLDPPPAAEAALEAAIGRAARFGERLPPPGVTAHVLEPPRHGLGAWSAWSHDPHRPGEPAPELVHLAGIAGAAARYSRERMPLHVSPGSPLAAIAEAYQARLATSPLAHLLPAGRTFDRYADGAPVLDEHRRLFGRLARWNRAALENPFAVRPQIEALAAAGPPASGQLGQALLAGGHFVGQVAPSARDRVTATARKAQNAWRRLYRVLSED